MLASIVMLGAYEEGCGGVAGLAGSPVYSVAERSE
jgi:hypothetical protein